MSALCKFLKFRNDQVIASFSVAERTHLVMDLFSSVDTEYHIAHLFVDRTP